MYDIVFANRDAAISHEALCPVCRGKNSTPLLTVKKNGHYVREDLQLNTCQACKSVFFLGEDPVIGYEDGQFNDDYWYHYVQSGAGIDAMLLPLLAIRKPVKGDLLDVGCGFSFVPHYWTTMGHGDAVGLESSRYGTIGSDILGTNVIAKYYNDAEEIRDRRFDYVFSSEVIEHVRDPHAFVAEIAQGLKPDGIMVLTTPSVAAASSNTDPATLGSALSPGFHYFLASKSALADILRAAGFPHVKVIDHGIRLFAWASNNPLPVIDLYSFDRAAYFTYLRRLSETADHHV